MQTSVLDKWLDRVDLPEGQEDMPAVPFSPLPQQSTSCSYLPAHTTQSFESLPKKTIIKRRPSDYLLSTMSSSSNSVNYPGGSKISKLLSSFKTRSSSSSVASSTIDSLIHIPQEQDEDDTQYNKALEVPIINPKDFDNSMTTEYYYRNQ
jgi:hypothetical protein